MWAMGAGAEARERCTPPAQPAVLLHTSAMHPRPYSTPLLPVFPNAPLSHLLPSPSYPQMARQITEMQVKLRELATSAAASPQPSPQQHMQQQQMQQLQYAQQQQQQQQARDSRGPSHSDRDEPMPFAARLLAQQQQASSGGGGGSGGGYADHGGGGGGGGGGSPSSPSHTARRDYQPRVSSSGAGPGLLSRAAQDRPATPLTAENLAALNSAVAGARGGAGQSPARGMLAADPPPLPAARGARLSDVGGHRASNNGRG